MSCKKNTPFTIVKCTSGKRGVYQLSRNFTFKPALVVPEKEADYNHNHNFKNSKAD